jgi:molybdenum cofactor cytidylyltransferase
MSSRLGRPKQLLPFNGTTLLEWVIDQAHSSCALDEIVVVLGAASEEVRNQVSFGSARVVENPDYGRGCSASYNAGIAALNPQSSGLMILLGDQPGVDSDIIRTAAAGWKKSGAAISLCSYRQRQGHPMIFSKSLYPDLRSLHGDKAAWKLVDGRASEVNLVEIDRDFPEDIDTWEDYQRIAGRVV